jgi:hypothetical protein
MALSNAQKLAEAETALHDLQTGRLARVFVDQNGERVEFNSTNRAALEAYIAKLTGIIAGTTVTGPIGFFF